MARLPTVILQHPHKGRRIVNEYDYARSLVDWARDGWRLVSTRHGDATPEEERAANREAKIQHFRTHDPGEVRKRGDAERAFEAQRIEREIVTDKAPPEPEPEPAAEDASDEAEASQEAPEVEYDPDWRELPFFKRKAYVLALTGKTPKTASDADRIMARWLEENSEL